MGLGSRRRRGRPQGGRGALCGQRGLGPGPARPERRAGWDFGGRPHAWRGPWTPPPPACAMGAVSDPQGRSGRAAWSRQVREDTHARLLGGARHRLGRRGGGGAAAAPGDTPIQEGLSRPWPAGGRGPISPLEGWKWLGFVPLRTCLVTLGALSGFSLCKWRSRWCYAGCSVAGRRVGELIPGVGWDLGCPVWLPWWEKGWPLVEDPVGRGRGGIQDQALNCACVGRPWYLVCFNKCWQVWGAGQRGEELPSGSRDGPMNTPAPGANPGV